MEQFLNTETLIIELLLIASLVAILVRRLRIPYTVALVIVGLLLTTQSTLQIDLTPELILALFVPPLVFEAAFHLSFVELQRKLPAILILAVPGVILTTLIVGGILSFGIGLNLPVALLFGALIAATDPVAVVALFRILGVPKELSLLIEGESLLNDGTALVLFNLMLAVVLTGEFNFFQSVLDFVRVSFGGIAIGLGLGWVISRLISRIDDYLIETTLTTVLAFGSYLLAEQLHFSGVLAVVAAGLINGNMGSHGMSPTTRIVLYNFWEYVAFLANSLVFLLIGLKVDIPALIDNWQAIIWAIAAVLVARVIVVYGLGWIANRWSEPISLRWRHVMTWGGMRGALSLALALSLPAVLGQDRPLLLTMAFAVVLFTLLIQATTMQPLLNRLGILIRNPAQIEYETRQAELAASRAAEAHLERRFREGLVSAHVWESLKPKIQEQNAHLARSVREILKSEPALEIEEEEIARREILRTKRSAYQGLRRDGVISEEAFNILTSRVDSALYEDTTSYKSLNQGGDEQQEDADLEDQVELRKLVVEAGSRSEGNKVRYIPWPDDFIIASVKRGKTTILPRGDTTLHAGDVLFVYASLDSFHAARELCQVIQL